MSTGHGAAEAGATAHGVTVSGASGRGGAQERVDMLEQAFGPLDDPANPLGGAAFVAADAAGAVPPAAEAVLDAYGLNAEFVPAALGGRLRRMDELGRLLRPVFRRDASLGFGYGLNCFFAATPVWTAGDRDQRELVAGLLLGGSRVAVARHGVAHGNDFVRDEFTAVPAPDGDPDDGRGAGTNGGAGGGRLLRGSKTGIANASRADGLVVFARTGTSGPPRSHSVFLLDRRTLPPGRLTDLDRRATPGMRGAEFGGLHADDCPLPASALIGSEGDGYELSLRSSLVIRGLIPSIVLAGGDSALRTVAAFAARRRPGGRSSLDVQHVRDVLSGALLDLLIIDCLALAATRALHLLPKQVSAYSAAAAYLAPKLTAESMDEMSAVLGEETFAEDGAYGMFQKQLRDLPVTSLGHAGSAGRQVSLLPQLPFFAQHAWFADPEAPARLFRLHEGLPPLDLSQPALLGDADPLAATLVASADLFETEQLPRRGTDAGALRFLVRALTVELDDLRKAFVDIGPDRKALSSPHSLGLADRYTLVLAAAACLGVWREQQCAGESADPFLSDTAWPTAVLYRLSRRLGLALPDRCAAAEQRVLAEVLARLRGRRSYDLYASPLA
ncbi:acyl-CoA dehydrogenase family protein [Streptomyces candidus]|uniref:Alkylation response protein AidB-like acyl-CoA dehydrogenase n=1 Tax=Streptomyces candidus TaxID=67283 RepID=A0A7X0LQR5_9ACTN|nr:acyl-CoA dehydrogenase family protein [Streptomyces candidus]MBB6436709.1 alkylation response protein AidB-like acyl-CoA dehydrogenase [Streptomyces candidus]GHH51155.1 acyl-CoA dehydrogenase [Streptomyces candidus]